MFVLCGPTALHLNINTESNVAFNATPNPSRLNKICLNQI